MANRSTGRKSRIEVLDHTADIGLRTIAPDLETVFEDLAWGMFDLIVDEETVEAGEKREIILESSDCEALLVDWLNELLYILESENFVFKDFEITSLSDTALKAAGYGEPLDQDKHQVKLQVKACTYHQLKIEQTDSGWMGQVIFDI